MKLFEDRVGGGGPAKWLAAGIVVGHELIDALDELLDAGERAAADRLVDDQGKEAFDLMPIRNC